MTTPHRQLIYVPEINPNTFLLFYWEDRPGDRSYSLREYKEKRGEISVKRALEYPQYTASQILELARYKESGAAVHTEQWAYWRQIIEELNKRYLQDPVTAQSRMAALQPRNAGEEPNAGQLSALDHAAPGPISAAASQAPGKSEKPMSSQLRVLQNDINQVRIWLAASIIAAVVTLILIWLTIQQFIQREIPIGAVSTIVTVLSGLLSGAFFRNYDKANTYLNHLRTKDNDREES